jgi:predicted nucleotidyltransferase
MSQPLPNYAFFQRLAELPFVEAIWLFGSRARGTHAERADIDLAISCPSAGPLEWQAVLDVIEEADTLLRIDCVHLEREPLDSPLRHAIERECVPLYQRKAA